MDSFDYIRRSYGWEPDETEPEDRAERRRLRALAGGGVP